VLERKCLHPSHSRWSVSTFFWIYFCTIPQPPSIMPPKEKYSDPKLRDEVKEEIHNGDKGGAPGQWSARKAQMMAAEYVHR
jgi:hypothetical protein